MAERAQFPEAEVAQTWHELARKRVLDSQLSWGTLLVSVSLNPPSRGAPAFILQGCDEFSCWWPGP